MTLGFRWKPVSNAESVVNGNAVVRTITNVLASVTLAEERNVGAPVAKCSLATVNAMEGGELASARDA